MKVKGKHSKIFENFDNILAVEWTVIHEFMRNKSQFQSRSNPDFCLTYSQLSHLLKYSKGEKYLRDFIPSELAPPSNSLGLCLYHLRWWKKFISTENTWTIVVLDKYSQKKFFQNCKKMEEDMTLIISFFNLLFYPLVFLSFSLGTTNI